MVFQSDYTARDFSSGFTKGDKIAVRVLALIYDRKVIMQKDISLNHFPGQLASHPTSSL